MNRKIKRYISILLSVATVFASLSVTVLANGETVENQEFDLLGVLSAKYESNGDPGVISSGVGDAGGASYGAYQFSSNNDIPKQFFRWLIETQYDTELGWRLSNAYDVDHGYGLTFNSEWKAIASEKGDYFLKLQRAYVRTQYYNPVTVSLRGLGFEINNYSIALKNVVWSRALQHGNGGAMTVFKRAFENIGGFNGKSEPELIRAIYSESGITGDYEGNKMYNSSSSIVREYGLDGQTMRYFGGCSGSIQAGVWLRLNVNEPADALAMYEQYKDSIDDGGNSSGRKTYVMATLAHISDGRTQVNIRTGPSTDSTVITAKDGGTRLYIIANREGNWFPVRFESNGLVLDGYCHSNYVTVDFDSEVVVFGDADGNGWVNMNDALLVLQNAVGKVVFTEKLHYTCNVDFLGGISMSDALLVLQKAVNKIEGF